METLLVHERYGNYTQHRAEIICQHGRIENFVWLGGERRGKIRTGNAREERRRVTRDGSNGISLYARKCVERAGQ